MYRLLVFIFSLLVYGIAAAETYTAVKNAKGVQEVVMDAKSYLFSPDRVIVQVNVPVELKIKKSGWLPHDFIVDDPASRLNIKQVLSSSYSVIKFTPEKKGEFAFYCGKKPPFGKTHRKKGMEGVLAVK